MYASYLMPKGSFSEASDLADSDCSCDVRGCGLKPSLDTSARAHRCSFVEGTAGLLSAVDTGDDGRRKGRAPVGEA